MSSYGATSFTSWTPPPPAAVARRRLLDTHCAKDSHTTGHWSTTPNRSASSARSSSVVTGVILSTMELGNATSFRTHSPRPGSRSSAKADRLWRATSPFPWMLSQRRR